MIFLDVLELMAAIETHQWQELELKKTLLNQLDPKINPSA
jgi:hypothetical protein